MRARGAKVTDIVVLVVAADDGVKETTIEAINHAKAAKVPIIVCINKIDLSEANSQNVKNQLMEHEILSEEMGGKNLFVEVSAKSKKNLDKLEEAILLQAEILNLKANPSKKANGVIVESKVQQGKGSTATVLIQEGTLKVGNLFVAGPAYGKVRAMNDDLGKKIIQADPAVPVEIIGINGKCNISLIVIVNLLTYSIINESRNANDNIATIIIINIKLVPHLGCCVGNDCALIIFKFNPDSKL